MASNYMDLHKKHVGPGGMAFVIRFLCPSISNESRRDRDGLLHIYIIDMVIEQSQSIVTSQSKYVCSRDT